MNSTPMSTFKRTLVEWVVVGAAIVSLIAAGVLLGAADLAMFATVLVVPVSIVLLLRRRMSLVDKLKLTGPVAIAMPVLLCVTWLVQFPGRTAFFLVGGVCALVFFVSFELIVKLAWKHRDAG
jgi:hypothetical protein